MPTFAIHNIDTMHNNGTPEICTDDICLSLYKNIYSILLLIGLDGLWWRCEHFMSLFYSSRNIIFSSIKDYVSIHIKITPLSQENIEGTKLNNSKGWKYSCIKTKFKSRLIQRHTFSNSEFVPSANLCLLLVFYFYPDVKIAVGNKLRFFLSQRK